MLGLGSVCGLCLLDIVGIMVMDVFPNGLTSRERECLGL